MPESWKIPVVNPLFTDCLAQEIVDKAKTEGPKPHAFDTRLRFSDSGDCARSLAYKTLGLPDVLDPASLHVAFMGSTYHELLQAAIQRRHPNAQIEIKGIVEEANDSGHCDALVVLPDGTRTIYELKTKSVYQFDMAVLGTSRQARKMGADGPNGPGIDVILQGALNCLAHNCDLLTIGFVCFNNLTPALATKLGLRRMDQFLAEWHIPRDVWEPLAKREIERTNEILEAVDLGYLPAREVYDEKSHGELTEIDPGAAKPYWKCADYCSFVDQCIQDGPGTVEIPVEIRKSVSA